MAAATPVSPSFVSEDLKQLVAELEQLAAEQLRALIDASMAAARAERAAKLVEEAALGPAPVLGPPPQPLPPILKSECGAKYADLLIVRGNPPDDPCGPLLEEFACNELDAKAYNERGDEIYVYCLAAWNLLVEAENERQSWPESTVLEGDPFWTTYAEMKRFSEGWVLLNPLHVAEVVQSSLTAMRQGACCLQKLNEALDRVTKQKVTPPFVPEDKSLIDPLLKPVGDFAQVMMWGVGGLLLLGAGVLVYKAAKK